MQSVTGQQGVAYRHIILLALFSEVPEEVATQIAKNCSRQPHQPPLTALRIALQLEVWTKDSERLAKAIEKAQSDDKKVREFTKVDSDQHNKQGKNSADVQKT